MAFYKCPQPRPQFLKKEERAPGPYSNLATLSPEQNRNGHPLDLIVPRIFQLALITTDSKTYLDPNSNSPPRPPPPAPLQPHLRRRRVSPSSGQGVPPEARRKAHLGLDAWATLSLLSPPGRKESGFPGQRLPTPRNPTRFPQQCGLRENRAHSPSQQHQLRDPPAGSAA